MAEARVCPECGADDGIEIELRLADDTFVNFCSCHQCEARWWNRDGKSLALDDVLKLAGKPKK